MQNPIWNTTVELMVESRDHFKSVRGSRDAMACLMTLWPEKKGKAFALARRACLRSLDGAGTADAARSAFVTAAQEAGILKH